MNERLQHQPEDPGGESKAPPEEDRPNFEEGGFADTLRLLDWIWEESHKENGDWPSAPKNPIDKTQDKQ
ncbi:hypothetical protein [Amycolatopsis sp. cmx-11-51]|uniref:hypothetical protein n=1 Tax=Amycolatopsis sp. cmx-11-51 TaxID=2785797 RepID=UPI0039E6EEAD